VESEFNSIKAGNYVYSSSINRWLESELLLLWFNSFAALLGLSLKCMSYEMLKKTTSMELKQSVGRNTLDCLVQSPFSSLMSPFVKVLKKP